MADAGIKISALTEATTATDADVVPGVQSGATRKIPLSVLLAYVKAGVLPADIGAVPATRTVNGQALSADVTLTAEDVGAAAQTMLCSVEATTTTSQDYAVGDLLITGGVLYTVTAAIASGATITPGTNVAATTVEELLGLREDLYALALGAYPSETESGADAVTLAGADGLPLKGLVVTVIPTQTGTPTPSSPIDVSGWTGANITISPTQDAQDGHTYNVDWTDVAGTIYGGTLDALTGVLTVTREKRPINSSKFSWSAQGNDVYRAAFNSSVVYANSAVPGVLCSAFEPVAWNTFMPGSNPPYDAIAVNKPSSTNYLYVRVAGCNDSAATFKSTYGAAYVVLELANPTETYQLTPIAAPDSMLGENHAWADCGEVAATYRLDPTLVLAQLRAAAGNRSLSMAAAPAAADPSEEAGDSR